MLKKTIKYTDFNDIERSEDFFFNFSEAELIEMNLSHEGGLQAYIERIVNTSSTPELIKLFKKLILDAVGERSDDGKRFVKVRPDGSRVRDDFEQTNAYSALYMELIHDANAAGDFINGCIPKKLAAEAAKAAKAQISDSLQS